MSLALDAWSEVLDRERRRDAWTAWHVAALSRIQKGRLPSIDDLLGVKRPVLVQTPDEMKSMFAALRMSGQ